MKNILLFILIFAPFWTWAQQEQTLHFMQNVWHSNLTNPAIVPNKKINIALPSVGFNIYSPDFTFKDLLNGGDNRILTFQKLANNLTSEQNTLETQASAQVLGVAIPLSTVGTKWTLNAHLGVNGISSTTFSRNAAKLFAEGNEQFLGQKVPFDTRLNGSIYAEIGIGAAVKLPSLTVGGRVKLYSGAAAVFTPKDKLNISFDKNTFDLAFDNDFDVQTFGVSAFDSASSGLKWRGINGFGFDVGASLQLGKIRAAVSLVDVGGHLNWSKNAKRYTSSGQFNYSGIRTTDFFQFDSLTSSQISDTIKNAIGFQETDVASFRQSLPTKIYLSGSYQLYEKLRLGALIYIQTASTASEGQFGVSFDATTTLFEVLEVGGTLNFRNRQIDNLGAHLAANLGPVQIFAVSDNILTTFQPFNSNRANGRFGINLMF